MGEVETVIKNEAPLEKSVNLRKLIGKKVISKGGQIIGKISKIMVNQKNSQLEGVFIKRQFLSKPIYIGRSYFSNLSYEAVILNIELTILLKGKKVVDSNGKIIGKVVEVLRKDSTNDLKGVVVKSLFSRRFIVPRSGIKSIGNSIILKSRHNAQKKYFWNRVK